MSESADREIIESTHNTARYFVEKRHVAWVAMVAVVIWGVYGYTSMPKRKDPSIPVHVAVASCIWPGVDALRVEQLVTRQIEQSVGETSSLHLPEPGNLYAIKSLTLPGVSIVNIQLAESVSNSRAIFDQIAIRLDELSPKLPQGAQPIQFNGDFGETSTLMLTVASPIEDDASLSLRGRSITRAIEQTRAGAPAALQQGRATLVIPFPQGSPQPVVERYARALREDLESAGLAEDVRSIVGAGVAGLDAIVPGSDEALLTRAKKLALEGLRAPRFHADAWPAFVVRDPDEVTEKLSQVAGAKYTYRELDDYTRLLMNALRTAPTVAKVDRTGVLNQQVLLEYSQDVLASYGLEPADIRDILTARNVTLGAGALEVGDTTVQVSPTGAFETAEQIEDVMISRTDGAPVYLRDIVDVLPSYQSPPRFLNSFGRRSDAEAWERTRAITLSVVMREGEQVERFGDQIDAILAQSSMLLPGDLVLARTSDQPRQVEENLSLFMEALYEAVALVVLVALIGFWEWRSALLMALAIPLTLAMTFGMAYTLGVELQQVSVAALIIALGLLVDDPVVAGDAVKRELASGKPRQIAAWLGPTRLAHAIFFATLTNIIAYLPFLYLPGNSGMFVHSLPIVMTCALVASRIVSMTFVPLLAYHLLREPKKPERPIEQRRTQGFTGFYFRLGSSAIEHRWAWAAGSVVFLACGVLLARNLPTSFFPEDVQYLSYVDIWLPTDAPLATTRATVAEVESVILEVIEEAEKREGRELLVSLTAFEGGGSPRFWFSLAPEPQQPNYAMLVLELTDKNATPQLVAPLQSALNARVAGAQVEVHQLETNPVGYPIEVEVSARATFETETGGADIRELRRLASEVERILRAAPEVGLVRNDWTDESFAMTLEVDPDRANLAGVTNLDVATSATAGLSGMQVGTLLQGSQQVPIVARLRSEERSSPSSLEDLYVLSNEDRNKVPLLEIATLSHGLKTQRFVRRDHFRAVTVQAIPIPGQLASNALAGAMPELESLIASLPPGYEIHFGGERAKQQTGNRNLAMILVISASGIFLALVFQFQHAFKPLLVFSAVPFGAIGAVAALLATGESFSFMAFLGIIALVGVIVSHVIVLFDFIEENHKRGEPLRESLLDAGIVRLRPIMITVGATVLALIPLAVHGGPLWQPLCYAQIGGLMLATFIELLLVKVFYAISVLDLGLIHWSEAHEAPAAAAVADR